MKNKVLAFMIFALILSPLFASQAYASAFANDEVFIIWNTNIVKIKPGEQKQVDVTIKNLSNNTLNFHFGYHWAGVDCITYTTNNVTEGFFQLAPDEEKTVVYSITAQNCPSGCVNVGEQINIRWGVNLTESNDLEDGGISIMIDIQKDLFMFYFIRIAVILTIAVAILLAIILIWRKKRLPVDYAYPKV